MAPRLSVVIVHSRPHAPLARCLDSLEQCRVLVPLEAIVVDQVEGGEDLELVRARFPWVVFLAGTDRRGFTFGINRGFARARAEAVLMLSPDCMVGAEPLERLLASLRREPGLAAAAPALVDQHGQPARSTGRFPSLWTLTCDQLGLARAFPDSPLFGRARYGGRRPEDLEHVDWASGAALLVPLALWRTLGGLDENMFLALEEVDWCRRAADAGHRVRYVAAARLAHLGRETARDTPADAHLHHLRSWVYYFHKHHGVLGALGARAVLSVGLIARWLAASLRRRSARPNDSAPAAPSVRVVALGLGAVWAGAGR